VFSLAPIVQLNIMESLGIMVFRHNIMHLLIFPLLVVLVNKVEYVSVEFSSREGEGIYYRS
jgi:hypothetical protein